jgi:hypothetical protein
VLAPLPCVDELTGSGLTVPTALDVDCARGGALVSSESEVDRAAVTRNGHLPTGSNPGSEVARLKHKGTLEKLELRVGARFGDKDSD